MPVTLQDAVKYLYETAVVQGRSQSPVRQKVLADYCIQELESRGLSRVATERQLPGGGRPKSWDVAWEYDGKYRLAISLKSILRNIAGTVPNRIDDLMGEAANVQLYSPEIVVGYVMVFDVSQDCYSEKHGSTWSELVQSRLAALSGRRPPAWTIGTVEGAAYIEVDFSRGPSLRTNPNSLGTFFDVLSEQAKLRNPNAFSRPMPRGDEVVRPD